MYGQYSNSPRNRDAQIARTGITGKAKTKRVFDNSMVAHVWAQQSQSEGRSANGNFYFRDSMIFSYGDHFPVAAFTQDSRGNSCVLFTTKSYSVTTSAHVGFVRSALRGLTGVQVYYVPEVVGPSNARMHAANVTRMVSETRDTAKQYAKPRKGVYLGYDAQGVKINDSAENRIAMLESRLATIREYAAAFDVDSSPISLVAEYETIRAAFGAHNDPAKVAARVKAATRRNAAHYLTLQRYLAHVEGIGAPLTAAELRAVPLSLRRAVGLDKWALARHRDGSQRYDAHAIQKTRQSLTAAEWLGGKGHMSDLSSRWNEATLLRRNGDRLETSRGAQVPFRQAVIAFQKATQCRSAGKSWKRNGETLPVGHFQVDSIDEMGNIKAGCHSLDYAEMQRLAVKEVPDLVKPCFPLPVIRRG